MSKRIPVLKNIVSESPLRWDGGDINIVKRELGGIFEKVCRCVERLRAKAGRCQSLAHIGAGRRGYLWEKKEKKVFLL